MQNFCPTDISPHPFLPTNQTRPSNEWLPSFPPITQSSQCIDELKPFSILKRRNILRDTTGTRTTPPSRRMLITFRLRWPHSHPTGRAFDDLLDSECCQSFGQLRTLCGGQKDESNWRCLSFYRLRQTRSTSQSNCFVLNLDCWWAIPLQTIVYQPYHFETLIIGWNLKLRKTKVDKTCQNCSKQHVLIWADCSLDFVMYMWWFFKTGFQRID